MPHPLEGEALWIAPFSSEPKAAGSSFVGLVQDEERGDVRFLGVDRQGRTRWSTKRDPEQGFLASRTSAAAYDPDTGELAWGPTEVPGTLLVHRDEALRAVGPQGENLWNHRELDIPPEAGTENVRVRYGPRPASDSGAAVVLEWVADGSDLLPVAGLDDGPAIVPAPDEDEDP